MRDRLALILGLLCLLLATLACNAFAGRPQLQLPSPPAGTPQGQPSAGEGATPGGDLNLAPTVTMPGQPTLTGDEAAVVVLVDLNVRDGPGVSFERVGFMRRGERAVVLGRDAASGWWRIVCPPAADPGECWVSGGTAYTRLETPQNVSTIAAPTAPVAPPPQP